MSLSNEDLERLADENLKNRAISKPTYCAECGYNLRGLPYLYTCPECGNPYNARFRGRKGVFDPNQAELPTFDFLTAAIFAAPAVILLWDGVASYSAPYCLAGIACALIALYFLRLAYVRLSRLTRARMIARRIADEQSEQ